MNRRKHEIHILGKDQEACKKNHSKPSGKKLRIFTCTTQVFTFFNRVVTLRHLISFDVIFE